MDKRHIQVILEFLKRTTLQGSETPSFNEVVFLLNEELKKETKKEIKQEVKTEKSPTKELDKK